MNEFTAALGILAAERLEEIVAWKNRIARNELDPLYPARLELPDGMVSGLYKYIVFEPLERSTGKVYDEPCHRVHGALGRPAEHRLGRGEPLVRAALLPAGGAARAPGRLGLSRDVEGARHRRRRASSARTSSTS